MTIFTAIINNLTKERIDLLDNFTDGAKAHQAITRYYKMEGGTYLERGYNDYKFMTSQGDLLTGDVYCREINYAEEVEVK